tara:strand:+ start:2428 stop:4509 length:2082 start_codon:yes stop_codon:yes gene_type:complete
MAYGSSIKLGNIKENWLVKLANRQGSYLYFAFSDVTYSSNYYRGVITNKPSIRESIDLKKSVSKTSNISIDITDFEYQGSKISKELFGGTNNYINQVVTVHSQINNDTPQQIGSFRLVDISTNGIKISLSLATHRPWDFIEFPQDQVTAETKNIYVPVVYGDYTNNESFYDTPALIETKLYPVPMLSVDEQIIRTLMPKSYGASDNSFISIWQGDNVFLPFLTTAGAEVNETKTYSGHNALETKIGDNYSQRRAVGEVFANESRNPNGSGTEFSNTSNAFDGDESTASTASVTGTGNYLLGFSTVPKKWTTHNLMRVKIKHKYSSSATFNIYVYDDAGIIGTFSGVSLTTSYSESVGTLSTQRDIGKRASFIFVRTAGGNGTLSVCTVKITIDTLINTQDSDDLKRLGDEKYFYSGGDGLTESWSGSNGAITEIHEVHRDLLIRFAGLPTTTPTGWGNGTDDNLLDHAKDWKIRYWQLEPVELKDELEKLQYEGGFIFRYRFDGTAQYIFIKDSYSATDVTLSKDDISNLQINPTSFSDLITRQDISYERHPANNTYKNTTNSSNSTARTNWNIQAKENIENTSLDYYVSPEIPNSPSSNPNDDFYTYYDNIFGDIKLMISCDIINSSKWVTENDASNPLDPLEVGSVIDFNNSNMFPETPMGYNSASWSGIKFIITNMTRGLGKMSIKARQI